jgi:hypothetical protein
MDIHLSDGEADLLQVIEANFKFMSDKIDTTCANLEKSKSPTETAFWLSKLTEAGASFEKLSQEKTSFIKVIIQKYK